MDSYLAGFLVGLLCVFAVGTILRLVRRKRGTERAKYDERQLTARGIAYRLAYFTLMLALLADVSATALLRPWAERGVDVFLCVSLDRRVRCGVRPLGRVLHPRRAPAQLAACLCARDCLPDPEHRDPRAQWRLRQRRPADL